MTEEEIIQLIKDRISLSVEEDSVYVGDCDPSESMFKNVHKISILIDDQVIDQVEID